MIMKITQPSDSTTNKSTFQILSSRYRNMKHKCDLNRHFRKALFAFIVLQFCIIFYLIFRKNSDCNNAKPNCALDRNNAKAAISDEDSKAFTSFTLGSKSILLEDILTATVQPINGKNIFFHETSKNYKGRIVNLTDRQACAVESAALMNPKIEVFVLFTHRLNYMDENNEVSPVIEQLLSYSNVNMYFVNLTTYSKNTPIHKLVKSGKIEKSKFYYSHLSDVLRYVTLYKYGGTYLDLDVIVLEPLDSIPPNYACLQQEDVLAAGIINLQHNGSGHEIATMLANEITKKFNPYGWSDNGPGIITRVIQRLCNTTKLLHSKRENCHNFQVQRVRRCYKIGYSDHYRFFAEVFMDDVMNRLNESLITHTWNAFNKNYLLPTHAKVPYIALAKKFCPKVLKVAGEYFN